MKFQVVVINGHLSGLVIKSLTQGVSSYSEMKHGGNEIIFLLGVHYF